MKVFSSSNIGALVVDVQTGTLDSIVGLEIHTNVTS
eukprot:SAG31_NODE_41707_length_275_cov_0.562500_1_plen_35_part_10